MATLMSNKDELAYYFTALDIPKPIAFAMALSITHWVAHNGMEFAVKRLKAMKQQRIHFENDSTLTFVKSHKDLSPYGAFRYLWKNTSVSFSTALQCLNIYSSAVSKKITLGQASKFVQAVVSDAQLPPVKVDVVIKDDTIVSCFQNIQVKHPLSWIRGTGKRAPTVLKDTVKTVPESELQISDLIETAIGGNEANRRLMIRNADLISGIMNVPKYELRAHIQRRKGGFPSGEELFSELSQKPLVGSIGLIQERGMKLRAVANPCRIWQYALSPLGDWLYRIVKTLDYDCTFDQDKGHNFVIQALKDGKTTYAFDLSNATDRFPLTIQIQVLRDLVNVIRKRQSYCKAIRKDPSQVTIEQIEDSIVLLEDLSRSQWFAGPLAPWNNGESTLSWKVGQPLGLYPSFAMFTITHGLLIRNLEDKYNVTDSFRVLGDDVIITDKRVAHDYEELMNSLGCNIAPDKTLVSSKLGEFAGKIFTANGEVSVQKWQNFSPDNPFGPLQVLGVKGLHFVPKKFRHRIKEFASLPKPFGLELNPDGIPLEDRVEPVLSDLFHKDVNPITDYTLSYSDVKHQEQLLWKQTVFTNDSKTKVKLSKVHGEFPRIDDLPIQSERVRIEHFNTHVRNMKGWEDIPSKLSRPDIHELLPTRGDPRNLTRLPSLNQLFKRFRLFKRQER